MGCYDWDLPLGRVLGQNAQLSQDAYRVAGRSLKEPAAAPGFGSKPALAPSVDELAVDEQAINVLIPVHDDAPARYCLTFPHGHHGVSGIAIPSMYVFPLLFRTRSATTFSLSLVQVEIHDSPNHGA